MVQVAIRRGRQLEGAETDVIQGLIIEQEGLIGILHKLVEAQDCIVRLHHCVRHFWGRDDGESLHDAIRVFLPHLGDEQGAHTSASTASQRVAELESLKAITAFRFLTHNIQDGVDQLGTLRVVALSPIVACTGLTKHKVVGTEELTERSGTNAVHGSWLQVHQHGSRHVAPSRGLVEVHVDALELEVGITMIGSCRVNAMLISDDLPELRADLVAALAALNVHELAHG
mmetsp:Transcript_27447/g.51411  ORF Transcript_27447/g.51411 Transcript_27447/m.51411 type:complete len:229 (+) Transcript_27447:425-1111(+)